jgi:DNA/RNA endonuclease YhcR with UshA esterase domain
MRNRTSPLAASLLSLALAQLSGCASAPPAPAAPAAAAGPVLSLSEVDANLGKTATVRFTITGVGFSKDNVFLNSQRAKDGFICFIPGKSHDEFIKAFGADLKSALEGKTVEATGELATYKDAPQIILRAPSQLKVVQ